MNRLTRASFGTIAIVALAIGFAAPGPAVPALAAPPPCKSPAEPGQVIRDTPWQQRWLAPERVWPLSRGVGVKVAVIDSGADPTHPQLAGRVLAGYDAVYETAGGDLDCSSHGTAVASIIAGQRAEGVGFAGLAPAAKILPVRVSERGVEAGGAAKGEEFSPAQLGEAIKWAVDNGADVINLSVVLYTSDPELEAAVEYAGSHDVVLVAAVGNQHQNGVRPDPVPFPAALDGVIGVGAIDETGTRVSQSQVGPYVDLVAPGGGVVAATRGFGHNLWTGTSFAAPMVSAAAALIRSAEPELPAEQVARRLIATADPARGGPSEAYGAGVLNLYRAVTERLTGAAPVAQPPMPDRSVDPVAVARADRWHDVTQLATGLAWGLVVLTAIVAGAAYVLPRGRRRRWRPTRPLPPREPERFDGDEPEEKFFQVPTSTTAADPS